MRFISKYQNLRVVLKPGIPGNRQTGEHAIPGKYVKFERGVAEVTDPEDIKMMLEHPGYGNDNNAEFIAQDKDEAEKYSNFGKVKKEAEPRHNITRMEQGRPAYTNKGESKGSSKVDEESREKIKDLAKEMVKEMLPEAVENEIERRKKQGELQTPAEVGGSSVIGEDVNKTEEGDMKKNEKTISPELNEDNQTTPKEDTKKTTSKKSQKTSKAKKSTKKK